jgi:hypothetical protein
MGDAMTKAVFPPDPLSPLPTVPPMENTTLMLFDDKGDPSVVRDANLRDPSFAVCVFSDSEISVFVPASLFTERIREIATGRRHPDSFLGMPMPESRFEALTYWRFKSARSSEFSIFGPSIPSRDYLDAPQYEAHQVIFDVDQKIALFTSRLTVNDLGILTQREETQQRISITEAEHPLIKRALDSLGTLINRSDRTFINIRKVLNF